VELRVDRGTAFLLNALLFASFGVIAILWGRTGWRRSWRAERRVVELVEQLERQAKTLTDSVAEARRSRRIVEDLPQLVWTASPDGEARYFNPQSAAFTGRPQSALLGLGWLEAVHPDDREQSKRVWLGAVAEGGEYQAEHCLRNSDGEFRWFVSRGTPIRDASGEILEWVGASMDITERRTLEARFRNAEPRFDLIRRLSKSSLWEFVLRDRLVANSYVGSEESLWAEGFEPSTLTGFVESLTLVGMLPEYHEPMMRSIQACVDGLTPEFQIEFRSRDTEGATRWRMARGVVSRAPDGTPTGFTGVAIDITDLKRAEAETRRVKERLEQAVRGSQVSVWDYELLDESIASSVFEPYNVLGVRPATAVLGTDYASVLNAMVVAEYRPGITAAIDACIRGESDTFQAEYRTLGHDDGAEHWRLARGSVVRDSGGTPIRFVGTSVDICWRAWGSAGIR
jgi:PAS domain S-box-containing protein